MSARVRFWIAQLLGYPVLVCLVWLWLGIPEQSVPQLIGSVLLGIAIVFGLAGLLASAFKARFSRMLAFVVLVGVVVGIVYWLSGYSGAAGAWLAAKVSYWRRRPSNPNAWTSRYGWMLWTVCAVALFGVFAWLAGGRMLPRRWTYWLMCVGLVIAASWLPWKLLWWVPKFDTITAQTVSLTLRFGIAYLLWLGSLLLFAAGVRRLGRQA